VDFIALYWSGFDWHSLKWQLTTLPLCKFVRTGFPKVYTAVKCGTSGHNVRVAPSLDATAIGMVVVGNQLTATHEVGLTIFLVLSSLLIDFRHAPAKGCY
jgi:hypothetical protein